MKLVALIILTITTSVSLARPPVVIRSYTELKQLKKDLNTMDLKDGSCISEKAKISELFEKTLNVKNIFDDNKGSVVVWTATIDGNRTSVAFIENASKVLTTNSAGDDGNIYRDLATEICLPVGFSTGLVKYLDAKVYGPFGDEYVTKIIPNPKDANSIELAGEGFNGIFTKMGTKAPEDTEIRTKFLTQMNIDPNAKTAATK